MKTLAGFMASGTIAWPILALTLAEFLALRGAARREFAATLGAGAGLLLAWGLARYSWPLCAAALAAAGAAHVVDLRRRKAVLF